MGILPTRIISNRKKKHSIFLIDNNNDNNNEKNVIILQVIGNTDLFICLKKIHFNRIN